MTKTEKVLQEMLRENTGRSILDSGDYYGRHWEKNQTRDFEDEPESQIEFYECDGETEIIVTHSTYHFLKATVEYDEEIDNLFYQYVDEEDPDEKMGWLGLMERFPGWLAKRKGWQLRHYYTINTYNGESLLDQVLQFVLISYEDITYELVLLQIHNGCDVRGGYTKPRVFRTWIEDGLSILDHAKAYVYCDKRHIWYTDDGYHFWPENKWAKQLQEYKVKDGRCPICNGPLQASL